MMRHASTVGACPAPNTEVCHSPETAAPARTNMFSTDTRQARSPVHNTSPPEAKQHQELLKCILLVILDAQCLEHMRQHFQQRDAATPPEFGLDLMDRAAAVVFDIR
eukprot:CAMPEP_0174363704 /NCGR_PEP_ID=MMETSP0811_2-20130205/69896_1 /TAXON_ID=73025 ORGANISM="Eutreptiella gymnastica-like, Strain CCMP1594" /NCGR_SAMPLE_ID=MMETSP0811_2 /ASSEMBLY_ACC=CAM_ASM_000667 /LENGTH=106 /DNA_ID=CAMNT_0015502631 /DNA_START=33 /DNA_END=354 /DNA_ORIENTATION=+